MNVPRETELLGQLKALVLAENQRQNLIAPSTIERFEDRHLADSVQLLRHLKAGAVLDIGSGGGFPGLVMACERVFDVHLVEPRAKRAGFLTMAAGALGLTHVTVHARRVQQVRLPPLANITARAVAKLDILFELAHHLSGPDTRWVLPKGRTAASELEEAQRTWQGRFRLIPSETDAEASIVIAEGVRRRQDR